MWEQATLATAVSSFNPIPGHQEPAEQLTREEKLPAATHTTKELTLISELRARRYMNDAQPVLAACCFLANNDAQVAFAFVLQVNYKKRAVQRLMQGCEFELALSLSRIMEVHPCDHVYEAVALRCERLGLWYVIHNLVVL